MKDVFSETRRQKNETYPAQLLRTKNFLLRHLYCSLIRLIKTYDVTIPKIIRCNYRQTKRKRTFRLRFVRPMSHRLGYQSRI